MLSLGIFADGTYGDKWNGVGGTVKGLLYGDAGQLAAQVVHVVVGAAWAMGVTFLVFGVAKRFMKLRVSEEAEIRGLDEPEFGAVCYPDFVLATTSTGSFASSHGKDEGSPPAALVGDRPSVDRKGGEF